MGGAGQCSLLLKWAWGQPLPARCRDENEGLTSRLTGLAAAFGCLGALAAPAGAVGDNISHPAFTSIQAELFNMPGSLANAWGDFDGDGDLDLAVSLKTGEIRLYRNDGGMVVDVGPAMGLPVTGPEIRGPSWGDYDGDG